MKKHLIKHFLALFAFVVLLAPSWGKQARQPLEAFLPEFKAYVEKSMAEWGVPGASIIIVQNGKATILNFGVKKVGEKDPITSDTVYPLVSLSKCFTVTLIARLVDQGKLNWDDKVIKYLPDFKLMDPEITKEFTVRDLLSHRSGLRKFAADSFTELLWSEKEIDAVVPEIGLEGNFRTTYGYQNIFVGYAGYIIEKVLNRPLSEIYAEYLFRPLHLNHTTIGKNGLTGGEGYWARFKSWVCSWFSKNVTAQHHLVEDKPVVIPAGNDAFYTYNASRGICSTPEDIAKWLAFQLNDGKIGEEHWVSHENIQQMRTPHVKMPEPESGALFPKEHVKDLSYGMGWFVHDYDDMTMLSHMGGMTGTRSIISIVPAENIGMIVVSNLGGMRVSLFPEAVRNKFYDLYLNVSEHHDWSKELLDDKRAIYNKYKKIREKAQLENPRAAFDYRQYAGKYTNKLYGEVEIALEGRELYLLYRGRKVKINHWNENTFRFEGYELAEGFAGNDHGEISFGFESRHAPAFGFMCNLFREGADTLFSRVK